MPNNMILLETIALTQSAASVTFDNLPTSGYTDLKIVFSTRDNNAQSQNGIFVSINGSTANFTNRYLLGSGSAASSGSIARFLGYSPGAGATANTFSNGELYFPNYRSSNNKSFSSDNVQETNASTAYMVMSAHLWSQTAAITSISLIADSASFVAGSTFSLYGIAALGTTPVLAPKATGGNIVENDGTYWIHTFLSSGVFTPQVGLTCDYLVIAGGGGGAGGQDRAPGGGGAGGYRTSAGTSGGGASAESALTLSNGINYAVTVGAGGAGATVPGSVGSTSGSNGNNSVFSTITSTAGGGGGGLDGAAGSSSSPTGKTGGSGGGGQSFGFDGIGTNKGLGTANQGYDGANGFGSTTAGIDQTAGGGGGAGSVASVPTASVASNGGSGVASSITGTSVTRAGGGGGTVRTGTGRSAGTGGSGGGGAGGVATSGTPGTANTGSGGGACAINTGSASGGNGGSGIVIIRYPIAS